MMVEERFLLAEERIREIEKETADDLIEEKEKKGAAMPEAFRQYFHAMADFLILMADTYRYVAQGKLYLASIEELK